MSTTERIAHLEKRKAELEKLAKLETVVSMLEHRLLSAPDQVNIARIVEAVCISFGVPRTALGAKTRGREKVSTARQACYWLCCQMGMGTSQVGRLFQRDHGAVSHGCRTISASMDTIPKFKERMEKLLAICRQEPGESAGATSHPGTGVAAIKL